MTKKRGEAGEGMNMEEGKKRTVLQRGRENSAQMEGLGSKNSYAN
jgi:hypothetical protein